MEKNVETLLESFLWPPMYVIRSNHTNVSSVCAYRLHLVW